MMWVDVLIGLGSILLAIFIILGIVIIVVSFTDVLHTFLRGKIFRDFDINKILPSGEAWDLSAPLKYGLPESTKVVDIPLTEASDSPKIAAWHMTPTEEKASRPTVLYLHGVAHTRGYPHRVDLYKDLLDAGFPVLAIDYRGFGDSTEVTDIREKTVVEDAHRALRYLTDTIGASSVIVWGHSQGAAIATHMMAEADLKQMQKVKLVLESPYNNMLDQIKASRRWHERLILINLVRLNKLDVEFRSDHWLPSVECPVLILHAADDVKVPPGLSKRLFEETVKEKKDVSRVLLDKDFGFGHHLAHYQGLMRLINQFWDEELTSGECIDIQCNKDLMSQQEEYFKGKKSSN